jgi:hypothetical protein
VVEAVVDVVVVDVVEWVVGVVVGDDEGGPTESTKVTTE